MVVDAVRTYLDAANGLTELSRRDAVAAARALLRTDGRSAGAATASEGESAPRVGQSIQVLAGELIETSQANRAAIADLVREEVGRQLETMDVVPRSEHERLSRRVAELERRLAARHAVERALSVDTSTVSQPSEPVAAPQHEEPGEPGPGTPADEEPKDTAATDGAVAVAETATGETEEVPEAAGEAEAQARSEASTGSGARSAQNSGGTGSGQAKSGSGSAKGRTTKPKSTAKRTTKAKTKK